MHHFIKILLSASILSLFISFSSLACTKLAIPDIDTVSAQNLASTEASVIILDVRMPEEYASSHIDGAVNIDISNDSFADKVAKLSRDNTYIVHCAANVPNGRTAKSLVIMEKLGFENLLNMTGGIVAWEAANQALIRAD